MLKPHIKTRSALLAPLWRKPPVIGGFPSQRTSNAGFYVFVDVSLSKRLNKQSVCRMIWDAMTLKWRHFNGFQVYHCWDNGVSGIRLRSDDYRSYWLQVSEDGTLVMESGQWQDATCLITEFVGTSMLEDSLFAVTCRYEIKDGGAKLCSLISPQ